MLDMPEIRPPRRPDFAPAIYRRCREFDDITRFVAAAPFNPIDVRAERCSDDAVSEADMVRKQRLAGEQRHFDFKPSLERRESRHRRDDARLEVEAESPVHLHERLNGGGNECDGLKR